ncbi:hypothetical protein [Desulfotruncus arcticus]|nr:hypothetical protein [Desulfotruncus arcticus]
MKKLLVTVVLIIFMNGCASSKDPPEVNINPEITATVSRFLNYSS